SARRPCSTSRLVDGVGEGRGDAGTSPQQPEEGRSARGARTARADARVGAGLIRRRSTRQQIPLPPGAQPGGPAPWAGLASQARHGITLERVRNAVRDRSGPAVAWAGSGGSLVAPPGFEGRPAAVLVALFEEAGQARLIFTRRAAHLRSHRGEVSFPGGRLDEEEAPIAGALREAAEEIGLDP